MTIGENKNVRFDEDVTEVALHRNQLPAPLTEQNILVSEAIGRLVLLARYELPR